MSNVRFVKNYHDYQGLIVTLPNGEEVIIDENPQSELLPYRLGYDMVSAHFLLEKEDVEVDEDHEIIKTVHSFYQQDWKP